jgi:hypothetical protein
MNNSNEVIFTGNTLVIPKSKFANLKKSSGWFNAMINTDFSNKNEIFDKKGNFILKKDLIYEIPYYDETETMKYIKSDKVWKVLVDMLLEGHTTDYKTLKLIEDYYMFNSVNSYNNPTLPASETVFVEKGQYQPSKSKTNKKKERRLNALLGIESNEANLERGYRLTPYEEVMMQERGYEYLPKNVLLKEMEQNYRKFRALEKKKLLGKEIEANLAARANIGGIPVKLIKNAIANRTKYGSKPGKLPGTQKQKKEQKRKEKRKTQKFNKARRNKTAKRGYNNNNNNNNNYNNNENNNYNE